MGKIKKTASSKHEATLSPLISAFIQEATKTPLQGLVSHLATFPRTWPFPRGDLYHWIPLLNRFDTILELFIDTYNLKNGLQSKPFSSELTVKGDGVGVQDQGVQPGSSGGLEADRQLVESILNFSRLLIENCGNRSLYASSAHLSDLLNSYSLSLLHATLYLGLRLAQRYCVTRQRQSGHYLSPVNPTLLAAHYMFDLEKVEKLAQPFVKGLRTSEEDAGKVKETEKGVSVTPSLTPDLLSLVRDEARNRQSEYGGAWITFYSDAEKDRRPSLDPSTPFSGDPPTPSRPQRTPSRPGLASRTSSASVSTVSQPAPLISGSKHVLFEVSPDRLAAMPWSDLAVVVEDLPKRVQNEFFTRLRIAKALSSDHSTRQQIVAVRMLAIANLANIFPEAVLQQKLLQSEAEEPRRSQLAYQLCDLIHPPGKDGVSVPISIQSIALLVLESMLNHKNKAQEVAAALNVNVNHGVLTFVVRKAIADLATPTTSTDDETIEVAEWRNNLFALLSLLPKAVVRAGEGFVAAGLLNLLVDALNTQTRGADQNHIRILNFLDAFVYNTKDAFSTLVNAGGLDTISNLISRQVKAADAEVKEGKGFPDEYRTQVTDYKIPFLHQQTLRALFKFMQHVLTITGGPFDRLLRNLLESSTLLQSFCTVIESPQVFGSNVWSAAVEIFSTFIHQEPTSFAALAEAGLIKSFLSTITQSSATGMMRQESGSLEDDAAVPRSDEQMNQPTTESATTETPTTALQESMEMYPKKFNKSWKEWEEHYSKGVLPTVEAITTIPLAFGAICLNESGMQQFEASKALRTFFKVFISHTHVKALAGASGEEVENLGASFDEITRHHPRLKPHIIECVWKMTVLIQHTSLQRAIKRSVGAKLFVRATDSQYVPEDWTPETSALPSKAVSVHTSEQKVDVDNDVQMTTSSPLEDEEMQEAVDVVPEASTNQQPISVEHTSLVHVDPGLSSSNSPNGVSTTSSAPHQVPTDSEYVLVYSKFLQGFFSNTSLCTPFVESYGIERLVDLAISPALPHDFCNSGACTQLTKVFHVFFETKPHIVLPLLLSRAIDAFKGLEGFLEHKGEVSYFNSYFQLNTSGKFAAKRVGDSPASGTNAVKMLLAIQTIVTILAKCIQPSHRSQPSVFTQVNMADYFATLIGLLGQLQSRSLWESVWLHENMPSLWKKSKDIPNGLAATTSVTDSNAPEPDRTLVNDQQSAPTETAKDDHNGLPKQNFEQANWVVVRHLLGQLPSAIANFYGVVSKLVLTKRVGPESWQKQNAVLIADQIADAIKSQLTYKLPSTANQSMDDHYRTIALSLGLQALMEKRHETPDRSGSQVHTLVLLSFMHHSQGFDTLKTLGKQFFENVLSSVPKRSDDVKPQRNYSLEALQALTRFLAQITNYKHVTDATQTQMLSKSVGEKSRPDYFSAAQFLVELRYNAMQVILPIWQSEFTDPSLTSMLKNVCSTIKNVLDGSSEMGAIKRSDKIAARSRPRHKKWFSRHSDRVEQIAKDRSVDVELAREALYRCADNDTAVREYCALFQRNENLKRLRIPAWDLPQTDTVQPQEETPNGQNEASSSSLPPSSTESTMRPQLNGEDILRRILESQDVDNSGGMLDFDEPSIDSDAPTPSNATPVPPEDTRAASETKILTIEDLNECRAKIQDGLMDQCSAILENYEGLTFELADLIIASASQAPDGKSARIDSTSTIVQSLVSLSEDSGSPETCKKIAVHAHLLGIMLQDTEFFLAGKDSLRDCFPDLVNLVQLPSKHPPGEAAPWLSNLLLVIERIMSEDSQPRQVHFHAPSEGDKDLKEPLASLEAPMTSKSDQQRLFFRLLDILPRVGKDNSLALAIVRVLVSLTRDRQLATLLGQRQQIGRLFLMIRQLSSNADDKLRAALMIVLRHVVEDEQTIRQVMRRGIKGFFHDHGRQADTAVYTRHLYHLVLRAPEIFVEVTNEMVMLQRFDRGNNAQSLSLKPESTMAKEDGPSESAAQKSASAPQPDEPQPSAEAEAEAPIGEKAKATEMKPPVVENPDGVVHFLLSELLAFKDVGDVEPKPENEASQTEPSQDIEMSNDGTSTDSNTHADDGSKPKPSEKIEFKAEEHPIYLYRCFLLQCLTELLQSYNRTKVEFINYSRKADPQAATPSKPRSGILNYILHALIPTGTVQHADDIASRKKANTSNWAICVIVSLCARSTEKHHPNFREPLESEDEPELAFVRRFVLEHAIRAFRDANASTESFDAKYSRLLSLADVFNRMLAGRPAPFRHTHHSSEDNLIPEHKQLAKIMYEKNFIAALTSSISDIDINFPGASRVVKYILRPLKLLTHIAIDISMTSDASSSLGYTDEDDISSATSVSDIDDEREETPDLFRNSTLGMFEPGRDEDEDSSSLSDPEEDEEDMYGDAYADDMDYDEDEEHNHHNDDVVSDEDEEMEGVGPMEGLSGDVPMELEIEVDEDNDDSVDEDEDEDEDDEEDEEDDSDDSDDEDDEDISIMDEINADNENASLADGEDGDPAWEDEDEDGIDFADEAEAVLAAEGVRPLMGEDSDHGDDLLSHGADQVHDVDEEGVIPLEVHEHDDMDEEESEDAEDVDEEDELDEDMEIGFEGEEDESDFNPFSFGWPGGPGHRHVHRRHFLQDHLRDSDGLVVPGYRSHRAGGVNRNADDGTNPLLNRGNNANVSDAAMRTPPQRRVLEIGGDPFVGGRFDPATSILGRENPLAYLNSLITALGRGGPLALPQGIHQHPNGGLTFTMRTGHGHHHMDTILELGDTHRPPPPRQTRNDPLTAATFDPVDTDSRWQEEARMLFGPNFAEKSQRVINDMLRLLVPPAIEAERIRKAREEEEAKKAAEERANRQAEREEKERKEREEQEAKEAAERAEAEAAAAERARAQAEAQLQENVDVEDGGHDEMEGVEGQGAEEAQSTAEEGAAAEVSRTFANIRGREIDITELGIDLEVLDALPEEMREEVIMQQYAEHRHNQREAGQEPTAINPEFLDALPPEIREELLAQEAQERRQREREANRRRNQQSSQAQAQGQPEEMDTASFVASLDPVLRQQVLLDIDEDTLAQLPPDIAAEARALGGHHRRRPGLDPTRLFGGAPPTMDQRMPGHLSRARAVGDNPDSRPRRPIVQMIDKSGIATLLRLMFVPVNGSARSSLNGILRNVCGNRQTRGEVIAGILSILQDGSADIPAIERSFNHLTLRAKQPPNTPKTPQSGKRSNLSVTGHASADVSPLMVIGQCLGTLVSLTHAISHLPQFFLTEHEAFKSKSSRKGKGKDSKSSKYPLAALLWLLDRQLVTDSPSLMEQLAGLLASVTSPLSVLLKKEKTEESQESATNEERAQPASGVEAGSTEVPESTTEQRVTDGDQVTEESKNDNTRQDGAKKSKTLTAPDISPDSLRLLINIMTARECNSKTFRDTLSTMTNLSAIAGARGVFGDELIKQARELGKAIFVSLEQLIKALGSAENEMEAQSLALANFSPSGSNQAKLNRILTALDYLFEPKSEENRKMSAEQVKAVDAKGKDLLSNIHSDPTFTKLWAKLSEALSATRQNSDNYFFNVATILLPLIESLMVVSKRIAFKEHKAATPITPSTDSEMRIVFFEFTNTHKKVLNDLVRHNPKLMSGSFSVLVKNSNVLEFDNKRNYFNRRLHHRTSEQRHQVYPALQLNVRRNSVFMDSYAGLHFKSADEIKYGKFNIRFQHEEGVDAGGVTREWFQAMARQMFDPNYALFNPVAADRTTFHPNSLSGINHEHLTFFKFIGRIIGKALYENRVLDCHFSRAVYKRILGRALNIKDMETIDLDYTRSAEWILNNDITDIITETFSLTEEKFGIEETIDLVPDGRNVAVTEENKEDYIRLVIDYKLTGAVKEQLENFLQGFHDIVPAELISIFDEGELELLISGMPDIDVDDWKNNTEYHNYSVSSPQIQWFWRAVRSFDKEERAKLLQFVTGTGKVPLNGFKELEGMNGFTRFNIHKDFGNKDRLPSSHTCFNQLDLPEYESYEALRKALYTAMTTGGEYFGFA